MTRLSSGILVSWPRCRCNTKLRHIKLFGVGLGGPPLFPVTANNLPLSTEKCLCARPHWIHVRVHRHIAYTHSEVSTRTVAGWGAPTVPFAITPNSKPESQIWSGLTHCTISPTLCENPKYTLSNSIFVPCAIALTGSIAPTFTK